MPTKHNVIGAAQKGRILIIDDNLTNKAVLEDMLQSSGYDTMSAQNGPDGLKIVRDWAPSVILLDFVMPGMDGGEVCKKVRQMDLPVRPSVIIVSMKNDKKTVAELLTAGADDFLAKPVDEMELLARVRAQLRISDYYRAMEEDKKNAETLVEITSAVTATLDTSEILDIIVKKVGEATGAVRCSIVLVVKDSEGYVLASHDNPRIRDFKIDLMKYPEIREAINKKTVLAVHDVQSDPLMESVRDEVKNLKDMSILIVPIVFNDEVLGTLFLRTRKNDDGFTKKQIDFCRIVANTAFHGIKNARLFEKVSKEKDRLKEIAVRDQLTSLYNHNFFYSRLEEEFERAVRYDTHLAIIMMDIDDFKLINDTYGHRVGDNVLKELSAMIKNGVRKTDILARYGGEEFAIILPHTALKGAQEEAERLRQLIEMHSYAGLTREKITLSLGVAAYPVKGVLNSGDLVSRADDALYDAKRSGKNCVVTARDVKGGE